MSDQEIMFTVLDVNSVPKGLTNKKIDRVRVDILRKDLFLELFSKDGEKYRMHFTIHDGKIMIVPLD